MPRTFLPSPVFLPALAGVLFAAMAAPAQAQWLAVGRWGTDANWRYVQPGTWMVLEEGSDAVSVTAEAENHDGRLAFSCRREATGTGGDLTFDLYFGDALPRPTVSTGPQTTTLRIDGREFGTDLAYDPVTRSWHGAAVLQTEILDAFGWGSSLDLVNTAGDTVSRFRLNNSGGARSALRRVCGI